MATLAAIDRRSPASCASVACALALADSICRRIPPHKSGSQLAETVAATGLYTPGKAPVVAAAPAPVPLREPENPAVTTGKRLAVLACTVARARRYAASAATID